MTIFGVDIASHQGPNPAYPPGTSFVFAKASGGHTYRNEYLASQIERARAQGLAVGFYHYMFEPTVGGGDAGREARNFIDTVRPLAQPGDTLWLDVEEFPEKVAYTGDLGDWIVAWCSEVGLAFGCTPGVYCATWYLVPTGLNADLRLTTYPFWMASWQAELPDAQYMAPWTSVTVWQYNAKGIDKDRFEGTRDELAALGLPFPLPVTQEDPIQASTTLDADGVPVTTIRWGGRGVEVLGTAFEDIGVRLRNVEGDVFHRSIVAGQAQPYVKE